MRGEERSPSLKRVRSLRNPVIELLAHARRGGRVHGSDKGLRLRGRKRLPEDNVDLVKRWERDELFQIRRLVHIKPDREP